MKEASTLLEFANLFLILGLPLVVGLIAFLSYLRGHFRHLDELRKSKEKEVNENREMYIKMVVQNTIKIEIQEIHEMISELGKRIDKLFALLKHDR
jgi:Tfp pilus assembly protein PilO